MGRANSCAIGVQIQIIVPKQTYLFSPDTSCLGYSIKCQTMRVLEIIWAQRHTASCMSRHYSRWLMGVFCPPPPLLPPNGPINEHALSLVPGYHSFPKWDMDGYTLEWIGLLQFRIFKKATKVSLSASHNDQWEYRRMGVRYVLLCYLLLRLPKSWY